MNFRIAESFTDSLGRLTGDEQKATKTTAFDLQLNPTSHGLRFHKLDKARDKSFWSVRVNDDLRIIVHRTGESLLLCYVAHHDKAYTWAERRKIETHPSTGAAQIVEIRELVREIEIPTYVHRQAPAPTRAPLFASTTDEELLSFGVPIEWMSDVRAANDEDSLLALAVHIPAEAAEALLELATGGRPQPRVVSAEVAAASPFEHPDAQRRFATISSSEELERALSYPWDKWTVFLHPDQRELVEGAYDGPFRVTGSAGTGKTIVALHRAAHVARAVPDARVLLATFSDTLARALHARLRRLLSHEPRLVDRIDVDSLDAVALRLYRAQRGKVKLVERLELRELIEAALAGTGEHKFSVRLALGEWDGVVDEWHLTTWEQYRDAPRLGRRARLSEQQRRKLWSIFATVWSALEQRGLLTMASVYAVLVDSFTKAQSHPYDFVVVDEAQDLSVSQLRFIGALGSSRPDAVFLTGDSGQRIFQQPFSWRSAGLDFTGRSRELRVNYRTSHQIRTRSDQLLPAEIADHEGGSEARDPAVSTFTGPEPRIEILATPEAEGAAVGGWVRRLAQDGIEPHEIAVVCRSNAELPRARAAMAESGLTYKVLDDKVSTTSGQASICTMHLAKGLEFRAVAVIACDDDVIPSQERIESVGDEGDLAELYATERQLLYVACTRAREHLLLTSGGTPSEFLDDLR
jgi:hypothetical protein